MEQNYWLKRRRAALGMTPGELGRMVVLQTSFIGLLSGLAAIPLGLMMAWVLVLRPHGLLARPAEPARGGLAETPIGPAPPALKWLGLAALAAAILLPPFAGDYALTVLTDLAVFVLFAASLHFIMGPGGMAGFGQAAYLGRGADGAALERDEPADGRGDAGHDVVGRGDRVRGRRVDDAGRRDF